ncbi:MAG: Molybdopterin biosynthesis protein MoeA [Holophagaceae bacterium]|nr:Molybdopterin biosynthesis protein MoeA [Holophagaceae bacterium]
MTTYAEALQLILELATPAPPVAVPLAEALGLTVAEDILAPEALPPFTNSAMDGFALRGVDILPGIRIKVLGTLAAGQTAEHRVEPGTALRIMTGAPLPEGADTVVPLEHTKHGEDWVEFPKPTKVGANVRFAGEDLQPGALVLATGTVLKPAAIGVLASLGLDRVRVHPRPKVAIMSTGNELVDATEKPGPGQIRDSNCPGLCAQISTFGAIAHPFARVQDSREAVESAVREALASCEVLVTTGGVSEGDYDFTKVVLEELGAHKLFWKVAQKPGGPFGVWTLNGKFIFGVPGNPVPAMVMVEEYVRPTLRKMMGLRELFRPEARAVLDDGWKKGTPDGKTHILRVITRKEADGLHARLTGPQGSGVLSSMLLANGLALVPGDTLELPKGAQVLVHLTEEAEDH